ncbi:cytochrome c4 [Lichenihabitans sp. PAMC28606]|uniref:c-type cytochrome n=1 Tax=Lichenihabitans sp. PAMC28606 TaxID=2880932 RepID=UPI001D0A95CA|nr:c-type cytochrome [Lichenihabitans sp. PAMC28606]UDL95640.1 cytochrome c4 [Lichenihabitans sp. PAMC28606]
MTFLACLGAMFVQTIPHAFAETIEETAAVCSGCHGEKGIPTEKNIPIIWGQMEGYLYLQLRDLKKGARKNEIMSAIVADMDRDTMAALASYFAAKPWPALGQPSASDKDAGTAQTANSSVGCSGCHLDQYQGTGTAPRLAGQNHDYLIKTMTEFRTGERGNNPGMTSLMKATSESDLAALANYLAGF